MINEQLYLNNISIPLDGSVNPSLTRQISDIKDPSKRKTIYSKTITLPDSKKLREVLDFVYELNMVDRDFNPLSKIDMRYEIASETIMSGYAKLVKINLIDEEKYTFDIVLFGELGSLFEDIRNLYLTDLDLSAYDHIFNRELIEYSWDTYIIRDGELEPFNLGEGYVYGMARLGYNSNTFEWQIHHFPITIYLRQYLVSIFEEAGWTWDSTFLDSDYFKSLVIPTSPSIYNYTSDELEELNFAATEPISLASGTDTTGNLNKGFDLGAYDTIVFTNEVHDEGGRYNTATGVFTAVNGHYNLRYEVHLQGIFTPDSASAVKSFGDIVGVLEVVVWDGDETYILAEHNVYIDSYDTSFYTGERSSEASPTPPSNDYLTRPFYADFLGRPQSPREFDPPNRYVLVVENQYLGTGNQVYCRFRATYATNSPNYFVDESFAYSDGEAKIKFIAGAFANETLNEYMYEGASLKMSRVIPKGIKQSDLFMSIIKRWNLFVEPDNDIPNHLIIEPRDDYYTNIDVNIHELIDRSKEINYYPTTELNALTYLFKDKDDSDYLNTKYRESYEATYGEQKIDVLHDFGNDEVKVETIWSPTPMSAARGDDKVLPTIVSLTDDLEDQPTSFNLRLWYYGGLKPTFKRWQMLSRTVFGDLGFLENYYEYPYMGHFDDPYEATLDINFGLLREVYYYAIDAPIVATNNNVFNAYHSKMIREYTDEDTRIVDCYVNMKHDDFKEWSFRWLYFFDNAYHRLFKISAYNPLSPNTTRCQFLKIKEADTFVTEYRDVDGSGDPFEPAQGGGSIWVEGDVPVFEVAGGKDGNIGVGGTVSVSGVNNRIDNTATNISIQSGDNNMVYGEANNIKLINSSNNFIRFGIENVTLINTNGVNVTESDVTYIDGQLVTQAISEPQTVREVSSDEDVDNDVKMYECDPASAPITMTFQLSTVEYSVGRIWYFKKVNALNILTIAVVGGTIDGAATLVLTALNEVTRIMYDGTNLKIV